MKKCNPFLFLILICTFCFSCDQINKNLNLTDQENASFQIVSASITRPTSTQTSNRGGWQSKELVTYQFTVCIQDQYQSKAIRYQQFQILNEKEEKIPQSTITSDVNGCLKWSETFPYTSNPKENDYILSERLIRPLGVHYGQRRWLWLLDRSDENTTDPKFYDSHNNKSNFFTLAKTLNVRHESTIDRIRNQASSTETSQIKTNLSYSYESYEKNPIVLQNISITPPHHDRKNLTIQTGFLPLTSEISMELSYNTLINNRNQKTPLSTGTYKVQADLVAVTRGRLESQCVFLTKKLHTDGVEKSLTSEDQTLSLELSFEWLYNIEDAYRSDLYLRLQVDPVYLPENSLLTGVTKWFSLSNNLHNVISPLTGEFTSPHDAPPCENKIQDISHLISIFEPSKIQGSLTGSLIPESLESTLSYVHPFEIVRGTEPQLFDATDPTHNSFAETSSSYQESSDIYVRKIDVKICLALPIKIKNSDSRSKIFSQFAVEIEKISDMKTLASLQDQGKFKSLLNESSKNRFFIQEGFHSILKTEDRTNLPLKLDSNSCVQFKDTVRYKSYDFNLYWPILYKVKIKDIPHHSDTFLVEVPLLESTGYRIQNFNEFPKDNKKVPVAIHIPENKIESIDRENKFNMDHFLNLYLQHASNLHINAQLNFDNDQEDSLQKTLVKNLRRGFYSIKFFLYYQMENPLLQGTQNETTDYFLSNDKTIFYHDGNSTKITLPFTTTLADLRLNFTMNPLFTQFSLLNEKKMILTYYMAQILGLIKKDNKLLISESFDNRSFLDELISSLQTPEQLTKEETNDRSNLLAQFLRNLSGSYTLENELSETQQLLEGCETKSEPTSIDFNNYTEEFLNRFLYGINSLSRNIKTLNNAKDYLKNILGLDNPERKYYVIDNFLKIKKHINNFLCLLKEEDKLPNLLVEGNELPFSPDKIDKTATFLSDLLKHSHDFLSHTPSDYDPTLATALNNEKNTAKIINHLSQLFDFNPKIREWIQKPKSSDLISPIFLSNGFRFTPMERQTSATALNLQNIGLSITKQQSTDENQIDTPNDSHSEARKTINSLIEKITPSQPGKPIHMDDLIKKAKTSKEKHKISMCYNMLKPLSFFNIKYVSFDHFNTNDKPFFPISSFCLAKIENSLANYILEKLENREETSMPWCPLGEEETTNKTPIQFSMIQEESDQALELLKILKIDIGCNPDETRLTDQPTIENRLNPIKEQLNFQDKLKERFLISLPNDSTQSTQSDPSQFIQEIHKEYRNEMLSMINTFDSKELMERTHEIIMNDKNIIIKKTTPSYQGRSDYMPFSPWTLDDLQSNFPKRNSLKWDHHSRTTELLCDYLSQTIPFERVGSEKIKTDCINGFKALKNNTLYLPSKDSRPENAFVFLRDSPFLVLSEYRVFKVGRIKQQMGYSFIFYLSNNWSTQNGEEITVKGLAKSLTNQDTSEFSLSMAKFPIGPGFAYRKQTLDGSASTRQDADRMVFSRTESDEARNSNLAIRLEFDVSLNEYEKCLRLIKNPKYNPTKRSNLPWNSITYKGVQSGLKDRINEKEAKMREGGLLICGERTNNSLNPKEIKEYYDHYQSAYFRNIPDVTEYSHEKNRPWISPLFIRSEISDLLVLELLQPQNQMDISDTMITRIEDDIIKEGYKTLQENYFLFSEAGVYSTLSLYELESATWERITFHNLLKELKEWNRSMEGLGQYAIQNPELMDHLLTFTLSPLPVLEEKKYLEGLYSTFPELSPDSTTEPLSTE